MTIKGVSIGDEFQYGKNLKAVIVDFYEVKSLTTGNVIGYQCIAKGLGLAQNEFEVPFSTVARYKLTKKSR